MLALGRLHAVCQLQGHFSEKTPAPCPQLLPGTEGKGTPLSCSRPALLPCLLSVPFVQEKVGRLVFSCCIVMMVCLWEDWHVVLLEGTVLHFGSYRACPVSCAVWLQRSCFAVLKQCLLFELFFCPWQPPPPPQKKLPANWLWKIEWSLQANFSSLSI